MALTIMTRQWTQIANSITMYILRIRTNNEVPSDDSPLHLFNCWVRARGTAVENEELALWCVDYIKTLMEMPLHRLKTAAEIDNLI